MQARHMPLFLSNLLLSFVVFVLLTDLGSPQSRPH
mgnify:CR=1 FL=1